MYALNGFRMNMQGVYTATVQRVEHASSLSTQRLLALALGAPSKRLPLSLQTLRLNPGNLLLLKLLPVSRLGVLDTRSEGLVLGVGAKEVVPPSEAGRVAVSERLVVVVVVIGARPERQEVSQRPGEVVSGVGVDGLEQSESDPDVHRQDVQVLSEETVQEGTGDGSLGEDEDLKRVGVLGGETDGSAKG